MRQTRLRHAGNSHVIDRVWVADSYFTRLRGLIGRPALQPGEGIWIRPCQQVHTHFLGEPIDVVFLDKTLRIMRVYPELRPWRLSPWVRGASSVLELPAGGAGHFAEGDHLKEG